MATKIIKAWINGAIQEIEVEEMTSPAQPLSVEERVETLEGKHEVVVTKGNLLVGDGTPELKEMAPNEVLEHINGASVVTMTTEEYEALEATNANTLYMLTDSEEENYIATDDEIIELLAQVDMLPAITDSDGSILSDEDGNILSW